MFHFRFKLIVVNVVQVMHWKYLLNMFWPHYFLARILHILTLEQFSMNLQILVLHHLVSWKCIAIANVLQIIIACKFHMRFLYLFGSRQRLLQILN